jgi:hypothetical protein
MLYLRYDVSAALLIYHSSSGLKLEAGTFSEMMICVYHNDGVTGLQTVHFIFTAVIT